ncbi:hypothetical protein WJX72_005613 [[Myrmecia] bisecta]|uniref:Alpha-1,3-mannosyl-glycoprotein 2-beta-N-acetylglucosaminyltransferase n=1 Tax=[Myrmecia] bisecta TaxID=41462 RepID=A0AAW1PXW4_9CHLO
MRTGQLLLLLGAALFLALQVVVFNGYHNEVGLTTQQVAKDTQLEQQLALVLQENTKLKGLYTKLEEQLSEAEQQVKKAAEEVAREQQVHGRDGSNRQKFPLYISQDGGHEGVHDMALTYAPLIRYLNHIEDAEPVKRGKKENVAYYRIANHYKFFMKTFFDCFEYPKLIILEDDMELAIDFFSYFGATAGLLDQDPSLYCVSSWNDHGQDRFVRNTLQLYRSDFFPGLGWMLTRDTWRGFREDWPDSYWDDWIRLNKTRQGRQCIRPEVCRTYNFGEKGSSKGFFYKRFLAPIRLNDVDVDWAHTDLSYLQPDRYAREFEATYAAAPLVASPEVAMSAKGDVRLFYDSQEHYEAITAVFGMLREWKDGVPRAAYKGVVTVFIEQARIFIGPSPSFKPPKLIDLSDKPVLVDQTGALLRGRKVGPLDDLGAA